MFLWTGCLLSSTNGLPIQFLNKRVDSCCVLTGIYVQELSSLFVCSGIIIALCLLELNPGGGQGFSQTVAANNAELEFLSWEVTWCVLRELSWTRRHVLWGTAYLVVNSSEKELPPSWQRNMAEKKSPGVATGTDRS